MGNSKGTLHAPHKEHLGLGRLGTVDERFWIKVERRDLGCWLWLGALTLDGYGVFGAERCKVVRAHRWLYERTAGPVGEGLVLDHLCRVRRCVNPEHLEPVTNRENIRRGLVSRSRIEGR